MPPRTSSCKRVAVLGRRFRLRPRKRRRLPARVRGQRRQGGAEAVHAAQRAGLRHLHRAAQAEPRRASTPATPARTASSSSSSCANTAARRKSSAASRRSTNRCCSRWATTRSAPSPATGTRPSSTSRSTRSSSPAIQRDYKVDPGVYAAETYLCGEVLEHAVKQIGGKVEDKAAFMKALKEAKVPETLRGPVQLRRIRQRGRQHLHPQGRAQGRQAGQRRRQDLSRTSSQFWTYKQGRVPEEPGLLARLSRRRRISKTNEAEHSNCPGRGWPRPGHNCRVARDVSRCSGSSGSSRR